MVYRIDVWTRPNSSGIDPQGAATRAQIQQLGIDPGTTRAFRVFFIETNAPRHDVQRVAGELLADDVVEEFSIMDRVVSDSAGSRIEVHLKPGVMDPVASSTEIGLRDAGLPVTEVRTGRAYVFGNKMADVELQMIAARALSNSVVESVYFEAHVPDAFAHAQVHPFQLRHIPIRELDEASLAKLSRDGHLFLSLVEMQAVQTYYRKQGREPTDIELETLAQTWSEHCVHKTLKSAVVVVDEAGKTLRTYKNLIKETIFSSTQELIRRRGDGFCLSVFKDNAGVIRFDNEDAVCFKVETHNRPSAIEPYGGSATGIGGCIRDVLGTGLGAKPIASTDVFCVAFPDQSDGMSASRQVENESASSRLDDSPTRRPAPLPKGVIHPKRILQQVVAGVRDYGNRMGIPTVNGAVYFDDNYVGNPLVFCGCVGLLPNDKIEKKTRAGDAIVVMGGRTGRDGIHGATFSSAELTDKHQDEFSHAVQIGNAIEQKRMMDVLLQARDRGLYSAITDCGAGGLSSAVGEMGAEVGAYVQLEKVRLKYKGLRYDEIWISEAQERMVLSVPQEHVKALLELSRSENVESTVIGTFGTDNAELILTYDNNEVGRMAMAFVHDGIPMPVRRAVVSSLSLPPGESWGEGATSIPSDSVTSKPPHPSPLPEGEGTRHTLLAKLAHPNIASKHWIVRQYDHEVQGGSVIKPFVGPLQIGPSDAAVVRPKLSSNQGVILACGLAPHIADPYRMSIAAIDEAIRNVVCVGADLDKLAILDNFCWPGTNDEDSMGTLVRACEACRDAALALGVPFISGKDSLHNQFTDSETGRVIRIPPTLLISAIGTIDDVADCVTMDFKQPGSRVILIRARNPNDLPALAKLHRAMSGLVRSGKLSAVHDVSDGGFLVTAAEMCIASGIGLRIAAVIDAPFAEHNGGYVAELSSRADFSSITDALANVAHVIDIGTTDDSAILTFDNTTVTIDDLTTAWRGTLDW
ncbi:MAG: phosphoribosylformylglycinamidine synthase subunit PurS [Burkholderiales bacterium]|nr:phosphoribosylformylglycinamidine synthase subunit PurS [Phycisphaerae bacterium]